MFEITREKAIEMLVAGELEHITLDGLLEAYEDTVRNGSTGFNELTDKELAREVEFTFNKIEGVRII